MADPGAVLPPNNLPESQIAPPPPPSHFTIFRGPNGIRAGWRILIFLAIVAALFTVLSIIVALTSGGKIQRGGVSQLTPRLIILSEGVLFLFPSIAALIMARIEHRKYGDYGLPARGAFGKRFWVGALAGFVAISACLLAIFLLHGFRLTGLAIHGKTIATATLAWSAAFILVGLAEEFSFRGYLQYTLTAGIGFWPSAIILSCLFGVAHWGNPGETKPGLLSVVCFALLFCFILRRTGNLWWAVGFHAGWDWGQTFFYGVPDSGLLPYHNLFNCTFSGKSWLTGGSVGPEASVFTPIVLAVVALIVSSVYRENRYRAD